MIQIELEKEPSQQFTIALNNNNFDIKIRDIGGICIMDIKVEGAILALGLPIYPNQPIIPYAYLARFGNFIYMQGTDEYPTWQTLKTSGTLYYLTPEEINAK